MTAHAIEVTMPPVRDGNWSKLRAATDLIPGTLLIEDPGGPVLIFPVRDDDDGRYRVRSLLRTTGTVPACHVFDGEPEADR